MTVYFDGVHLVADSVEELHQAARDMCINRCWFDANKKHPHYDCKNNNKTKVLNNKDVMIVSSRFIVNLFKKGI